MRTSVICRLLALLAVLTSQGSLAVSPQDESNQAFVQLAKQFTDQYLEASPEAATLLGAHQYDHRLTDRSLQGSKKSRELAARTLQALGQIQFEALSLNNRVDAQILKEGLEYTLFQFDELRELEWNPLAYNPGDALDGLLSREFAPLPERLKSVKARLEQIPTLVVTAKENLKNPPRIHTETAIRQNKGVLSLIREDIQASAEKAGMKSELSAAQASAISALEDYDRWLRKDLLPRSNGNFRLGTPKYRQKLKFELSSSLSKEEILSRAQADLVATQKQMVGIATPLFRSYFPTSKIPTDEKRLVSAVLGKLAEKHPDNETIVDRARSTLQQATEFVRKNQLVTIPSDPIKIIVMPEYQRGVAAAYCDSAGPLETRNTTYFAISPAPKDWSPSKIESYFKEYNDFMLFNLTASRSDAGSLPSALSFKPNESPNAYPSAFFEWDVFGGMGSLYRSSDGREGLWRS